MTRARAEFELATADPSNCASALPTVSQSPPVLAPLRRGSVQPSASQSRPFAPCDPARAAIQSTSLLRLRDYALVPPLPPQQSAATSQQNSPSTAQTRGFFQTPPVPGYCARPIPPGIRRQMRHLQFDTRTTARQCCRAAQPRCPAEAV